MDNHGLVHSNAHGGCTAPHNETVDARFPHPNPPPKSEKLLAGHPGEGANESLREIHVKAGETAFIRQVGTKEARKLKAQRKILKTVWSGFGAMGLVGWSVAVPTLLGTALGIWLDKRYPGIHSWTLTLLIIGLFIGCINAW